MTKAPKFRSRVAKVAYFSAKVRPGKCVLLPQWVKRHLILDIIGDWNHTYHAPPSMLEYDALAHALICKQM